MLQYLPIPRRSLWILYAFLVCLGLTRPALGQINTADLLGTITDPTGALVMNANVQAENLSTGLTRHTVSRPNGEYLLLALPPGRYRVSAEATGFRPAAVEDVTLSLGQQARLSLQLEISVLTEAVVISAETALVETTKSSTATTIDQRSIESLATNGRSYIQFTLLDSGTTRDNQPVLGPAPTSGLNIGGQRARANMVSIDGADAIDNTINGVRATLSQEAVQEFQVIKSGYAPEYGRASSATINIVSKQGTNQWKGDLFGYLRSRHGSATNAFAGEPNPGDTRTQAGFTLGGPIKKDRTFAFISFETNLRNSMNYSQIGRDNYGFKNVSNPFGPGSLLLTPQQEAYVKSAPPALAAPYATIASGAAQVALAGNTAGGPTSFALTQLPLPASYRGLISEAGNYKTTEETYFLSARIDHQLNPSHGLFVRLSGSPADVTGLPSNGQNQLTALNSYSRTTNSSTRDFNVVTQLASSHGPALINEFRFQFARRGVGLTTNSTRVAVEIPGVASIGLEPFAPLFRTEKRWQFTDNVVRIWRSHTFKMGIDVNHLPVEAVFPLNQGGVYYFPATLPVDHALLSRVVNTPALTSAWKESGAPSFSAAQAYGLGFPESFVQQFGGLDRVTSSYKSTTLGGFFQDSWKVRRNFALNYGLRYDVEFTPLISTGSSISQTGEALLKVVQGIPRDTNNWAPRIGFGWDPLADGKTVIRGSYGLFYGHPMTGIIFLSDVVDGTQSPYFVTPSGVGADDLFQGYPFTPLGSAVANPALGYLANEQRFDVLAPAFQSQETALALSPVLSQTLPVARNFQYDYAQQGTFGIEHELSHDISVSADYTFTKGLHLLRPRNINQGNFALIAAYAQASIVCQQLPGVDTQGCSNPAYNGLGGPLAGLWDALGGKSPTSLAPLGQLLFNQFRATGPNYTWANTVSQGVLSKATMDALVQAFNLPHAPGNAVVPFFNVKQYESSGNSLYNALTLTLRKRWSRNYQLLGSWTWSHAIDDSTDLQVLQEPQDNQNVRLDRGNSNFDQRHRFVVSGVFDSPWRGHFLSRDWTLAPIFEVSSGRPYNLLTLNDSSLVNSSSTARPSVVPIGTAGSFPSPDGKVGLIQPSLGLVGNLGRNVYRTGSFASTDFRLTRRFRLDEARRLELSLDVFNLFNKVNIREADSSFTQAGRSVGAFDPRQLQYSVKIFF